MCTKRDPVLQPLAQDTTHPAHPTGLSQIAPPQGSSSHSAHGLLPDADNSFLCLRLHRSIHPMWMLTPPPGILPRTRLGRGSKHFARGVSRGSSTHLPCPLPRGPYTAQETPPGPAAPPNPGQALSMKREAARSLLSWSEGSGWGDPECSKASSPLTITWHHALWVGTVLGPPALSSCFSERRGRHHLGRPQPSCPFSLSQEAS